MGFFDRLEQVDGAATRFYARSKVWIWGVPSLPVVFLIGWISAGCYGGWHGGKSVASASTNFLDAINIKLNPKKTIDKDFVKFVFDEARKDELTSHVPAAISTAQAILETEYRKSIIDDIYSGEYSNVLFDIKPRRNPIFVYVNTHKCINGVKKEWLIDS